MMKGFQNFPRLQLILLSSLCFLSSWDVEGAMISVNLAQSVCTLRANFKETGKIQSPVKTKPSDSPSFSHKPPKVSYCWFYWEQLEKPFGFHPLHCSPRLQPPGRKTSTGGKSNTRIAYGEVITPNEFRSYGQLYLKVKLANESDPDSWDRNLTKAWQKCQATLLAPSWAVPGTTWAVNITSFYFMTIPNS